MVFVSFLSRYPSDTDNQIYLKSESRIWNSISLVLILCSASFQIYLSISPMCLSVLCSLSFDSTSENFEFRWSITDSILKALSVLLSFLLSAKCRFWRISQKRFQITVFWIRSLKIRLSTLQYSPILGNLLIAITKFSKKCFQFFLGNCEVSSILMNITLWSLNY